MTTLPRLLAVLFLICALPLGLAACQDHEPLDHHEPGEHHDEGFEDHHEDGHDDEYMGASGEDDAQTVIAEFWRLQDTGDYTKVVDLFAEDAVLVDPVFGTFRGKQAIGEFMAMMNEEMGGQNISFRLEELAADGEVAWAQWVALTPRGERTGVGVYRVEDGKMTYYRDYMNPLEDAPTESTTEEAAE